MISGANAIGRRWRQRSHTTQHHGEPRRSSAGVGHCGSRSMPAMMAIFVPVEQPRGLVAVRPAGLYMLGQPGRKTHEGST
jgi:hypothetical protein